MQCVIPDKLYFGLENCTLPYGGKFRRFEPASCIQYFALCDDFGPMNFASISKFCAQLNQEMSLDPEALVYVVNTECKRAATNAVFLLGSYLILILRKCVDEVVEQFLWMDSCVTVPYRDATYTNPDFGLSLEDCWRGLFKGIEMGWISEPCGDSWGAIDVGEYDHYENPLNGDLHVVVPNKFIAFKGPADLGGKEYEDDEGGFRHFAPEYYVDLLNHLGASAVVRLNEPHYSSQHFVDNGLTFHDLQFEDCSVPPREVVEEFFRVCDAAPGLVAVHCKAGLGRTGTLIALHLMRIHGFRAREAMGWLRIMRPGSVIGRQQHFLCEVEERGLAACLQEPGLCGQRAQVAAQVAAGMVQRGSFRVRSL